MTHAQALADSDRLTVTCDGKLIDPNNSFSSDVNWTVYTCAKCLETVFTVEGRLHWWNGHGEPSDSRREKQAAMRAERSAVERTHA